MPQRGWPLKIPASLFAGGGISSSNAAVLGGLGLALAVAFKVATDKKAPAGKAVKAVGGYSPDPRTRTQGQEAMRW